LEKRLNEIRKVTPDDINKAVKYIFDINSASVSYVGKEIDEDLLKLFVEGDN
jgi:predicted Zn-dependent peptidase